MARSSVLHKKKNQRPVLKASQMHLDDSQLIYNESKCEIK